MRDTGNESPHSIKPSANPATLPTEPARSAPDDDVGEGSYSGTRNYQASLKAYLETANVEKDAHNAAPKSDAEKRDKGKAEETGLKPARKGPRKSK